MEADLTDAARVCDFTLEPVNVIGRLASIIKVNRVPSFVEGGVKSPKVNKVNAII